MIYEGNKFIAFEIKDLVKIENDDGIFHILKLNNGEATVEKVGPSVSEMRLVKIKDLTPSNRFDAVLEFYPEIKKAGLQVFDYNCSWWVSADTIEKLLREKK